MSVADAVRLWCCHEPTQISLSSGVTWHPIHDDLLVSGGSDGSMLYWSLKSDDPETPLHAMEDAHDSNVWSLAWHPLGHLLASGSNDHTTKFWSRARAGGAEPNRHQLPNVGHVF